MPINISFAPTDFQFQTSTPEYVNRDTLLSMAEAFCPRVSPLWLSSLLQVESVFVECRDGTVVRALASPRCGQGSILRLGVICGLVLFSAPRGFSLGTPVFPSPQGPTFDLICINLLVSVYSVPN